MTDAVAIQLITTVGTIVTVIVTGFMNRRTTRAKTDELHDKLGEKLESAVKESRDSGAHAVKEVERLLAHSDLARPTPLSNEAIRSE